MQNDDRTLQSDNRSNKIILRVYAMIIELNKMIYTMMIITTENKLIFWLWHPIVDICGPDCLPFPSFRAMSKFPSLAGSVEKFFNFFRYTLYGTIVDFLSLMNHLVNFGKETLRRTNFESTCC